MVIPYYKVNPGGNITAIVRRNVRTKKERIQIARSILADDREIEQVGFWLSPGRRGSAGRLMMMGGEFCGNATRSLAYLIWQESGMSPLKLESSGASSLIKANLKEKYAEIEMPKSGFRVARKQECDIVTMPGITHIVTNQPIDAPTAKDILNTQELLRQPAAGVISVLQRNNRIAINPIVWVRDTATLYEETACASGTLAAAYANAMRSGRKSAIILQPSGAEFKVRIAANRISLGGPILSAEARSLTAR